MYINPVNKIFQIHLLSATKESNMKTKKELIHKLAEIRGLYAAALRERRLEEAGHLISGIRAMEWVLESPKPRVSPVNTRTRRVR